MFQILPWYGYVMLVIIGGSYLYKFFKNGMQFTGMEGDSSETDFDKSRKSTLNQKQLFSIALYTVISEWWQADTNTLKFKSKFFLKNYMEGWGLDTPDGYWHLTNYFKEDGRRWYFDFIHQMMKTEPEEKWTDLMNEKFGANERTHRYLELLKTNTAKNTLKLNGIITFDSELELGVAGYDAAMLVGHARKAYTSQIISESEAWEVIDFATQLAKENFSSWEEFGKSFMLGFVLDIRERSDGYKEEIYDLYKQVLESPRSPWNTINWQNTAK